MQIYETEISTKSENKYPTKNSSDTTSETIWLIAPNQRLKDAMKEREQRQKSIGSFESPEPTRRTANPRTEKSYESHETSDPLRLNGGSIQGEAPFTGKKSSPELTKSSRSPFTSKKPQAIRTTTPQTLLLPKNSNGTIYYSENNRIPNDNEDNTNNIQKKSRDDQPKGYLADTSQSNQGISNIQKRNPSNHSNLKQSDPKRRRSSSPTSSSTTLTTSTSKNEALIQGQKLKRQRTSSYLLLFALLVSIGLVYIFKPYLINNS